MGLVPKAATKVGVTARGGYHEVFTFLTREQALRLQKLEADVNTGK